MYAFQNTCKYEVIQWPFWLGFSASLNQTCGYYIKKKTWKVFVLRRYNSDLSGKAQFWKLWSWLLFVTPHNFANGPHFVALTQLRPTKTGSNICCTHLSYTFSEFWVRKDFVGTCPEKVSHWQFSGTERFTKKFRFSLISLATSKKKYRARVPTILMPQTFPIASLNPYTPNF